MEPICVSERLKRTPHSVMRNARTTNPIETATRDTMQATKRLVCFCMMGWFRAKLVLLRSRVAGHGFAIWREFRIRPEQPIREQAQVLGCAGGFQVVPQRRGKDVSLPEFVSPADDVLAAVLGAFGFQELVRLRIDRDRLVKFIARRFPVVRKLLRDGAFFIEFGHCERAEGIVDFGSHAAACFPFAYFRGATE